jgi:hypothetical protein
MDRIDELNTSVRKLNLLTDTKISCILGDKGIANRAH